MKGKAIVRTNDKRIYFGEIELTGNAVRIRDPQIYNFYSRVFENLMQYLVIVPLNKIISIEQMEYWKK